jgi:integrase
MKVELTRDMVLGLEFSKIPVGLESKKTLKTAPNEKNIRWVLWDASQKSPPGFGVRVAPEKKTYILRRKVHGKSIMTTVGAVSDFKFLDDARDKAQELAVQIVETGKNPSVEARKASASEITIGMALERFLDHLTNRKVKPATEETKRVLRRVIKRFETYKWSKLRVKDIAPADIVKKFLEGDKTPSATEQTFQFAHNAVRWVIGMETLDAAVQGRKASLTTNPFEIIYLEKLIRTRDMIEAERDEKNKRNPLAPSLTLGPFLEAAWSKKNSNDNETGIHYLLLMLLWGCRKSEHADCVWGELLPERSDAAGTPSRRNTSHVWLEKTGDYGPYVFFHKTKNGRNHRLPLGPMALELLKRRQVSAAEEVVNRGFTNSRKYVFPAKSKHSRSGHYNDATDLLDALREEIGIDKLNRHDLRRTFGAVMTSLEVPETIKKRFLNHANTEVTETYTKAEWALFRKWMVKIEEGILTKGPNVYNSLKPDGFPPLAAPEPHVCKPPKPRTGRPPKGATKQAVPSKAAIVEADE